MKYKLNIRTATPNDLSKLLQFEQGVIAAERPVASNLKSGDISYYDLPALLTDENVQLLVAEVTNENKTKLVGSGYIKIKPSPTHHKFDQHGYIGFIYLTPDYRGKGINQLLMQKLFDWGKSKGITEVLLDVYADNAPATKAYEKLGFKPSLVEMRVEI